MELRILAPGKNRPRFQQWVEELHGCHVKMCRVAPWKEVQCTGIGWAERPGTHIRSVKIAWHNALRRAGLAPFPIYNTRHTFATRLAGAGVSDTVIDQLLGHSRRDVLRFYTVPVSEYLRDAITRLEQLRATKTSPRSDSSFPAFPDQTGRGSTVVH